MRYCLLLLVPTAFLQGHAWGQTTLPSGSDTAYYSHPGASMLAGAQSDSCYQCHDKTRGVSPEDTRLCYFCHRSMEAKSLKPYQHGDIPHQDYPFNSCEGCHRLHRAPATPLLTREELPLCYSCHREAKEKRSHPVVSYTNRFGATYEITGKDGRAITCTSHCHDVHGTDYKYLCRLEPGRELCISCHEEFK